MRRDADLLSRVDWSVATLGEAQNIKNASSATARAARGLRATHRFALTGTPVENRLAELWSILEFANPGLLEPLETFRRDFALPIERYGNDGAATRLRRIVSPFILRGTARVGGRREPRRRARTVRARRGRDGAAHRDGRAQRRERLTGANIAEGAFSASASERRAFIEGSAQRAVHAVIIA